MPEYIITCPICRKQYKLTLKDPASVAKESFLCKNCKYNAPFGAILTDLSVAQPVSDGSNNRTKVKGDASVCSSPPTKVVAGHLTAISTGERIDIPFGTNTLGRNSSDSNATVKLTRDKFMSRVHARIVVQRVEGRIVAQVTSLKADNPVVLNGKIMPANKPFTLKQGDRLQMGQSVFFFTP